MAKVDIDEKLKLIEEQKQAQLEKLTQLKNQEKDLKAQQRKQKRELTRQQDTRLKILIGAYYLRQFNKNPELLESIKGDLISFASEAGGTAKDQNLVVLKELLGIEEQVTQSIEDFWNT
jgi:hypothetical protein